MAGLNKAILIGNLGKDPELRKTQQGLSVATFSLATTERRTDKGGSRQDYTEWHNIVAWGKLADLANQYLKKGRSVYVEGRITNRSWDDKEGNKRYKTEIVASQIVFLGSSGGDSNSDFSQATTHDEPFPEPANTSSDINQPVEDDLPF